MKNYKISIKNIIKYVIFLAVGFILGFYFGEKIYTYLIIPFSNTSGQFDYSIFWTAMIGISTITLTVILIRQNYKQHENDYIDKILQYRPYFTIVNVLNPEKFKMEFNDRNDFFTGSILNINAPDDVVWEFGEHCLLSDMQILNCSAIKNVGNNFAHSISMQLKIDERYFKLFDNFAMAAGEESLFSNDGDSHFTIDRAVSPPHFYRGIRPSNTSNVLCFRQGLTKGNASKPITLMRYIINLNYIK